MWVELEVPHEQFMFYFVALSLPQIFCTFASKYLPLISTNPYYCRSLVVIWGLYWPTIMRAQVFADTIRPQIRHRYTWYSV